MKASKRVLSILLSVLLLAMTMAVAAVPAQAYSTIQFGNYPQTQVERTDALEAAANAKTWQSYGYYIGKGGNDGSMTASSYMTFVDFFSNGVKYRAVKFTKYRPYATNYSSSASNSIQDDNGYSTNTTYYFKYEPLTWRVLDASTGLVLCDSIIDAQAYQNDVHVVHAPSDDYLYGPEGYANIYALSAIRDWLNENFFNTAFNNTQKAKIKSTEINNDSPFDSAYNSASTSDKIYLLSYSEAHSSGYGLSSASARKAKGTDYAKCQGLGVNNNSGYSPWWLRTPGGDSYYACNVLSNGNIEGGTVNYTDSGVRPACNLSDLTSDTEQSDVYSIRAVADPSAGGTVSGAGSYAEGATVTLTATPNAGYRFIGWYREYFTHGIIKQTLMSTDTTYTYTASRDDNYIGKFIEIPYYTITAYALLDECGTVTGGGTYEGGTMVTVNATANPGWRFGWWNYNGNSVSTDASYTFKVTENAKLVANYVKVRHKVTVESTEGGTATGGGSYQEGKTAPLTATPNEGYRFVGWFEGETKVSDQASYDYPVTKAVTLTAKFEADTPAEPENVCPWCGGQHEGFFQKIIGFFHNIFAKIFGAKY